MDIKAHLKALSAVAAPSGHEAPIRDVIRAAWADLVDECTVDGMGNLIATKRGTGGDPRRKIMLCAHMDEIGLIVAEIRDGFIRTGMLGGIDYRSLLAQNVHRAWTAHAQGCFRGRAAAHGPQPQRISRSR